MHIYYAHFKAESGLLQKNNKEDSQKKYVFRTGKMQYIFFMLNTLKISSISIFPKINFNYIYKYLW